MKKKIRRTFEFIKTHKKARIFSIVLISVFSLFFLVNFSRYVKQIIENYITRTERFYFNSDKLTEDNKQFEVNYWSGVDPYTINITVNSLDNNLRGALIDIDYTITCEADSGLSCSLSQSSGTISHTTNTDSFSVVARPTRNFSDGESASIRVVATTSEPYEKQLSAVFTFVVGSYGLSYKIEDNANQPYLEAIISNTVDYYRVIVPFGSYTYNQEIAADVYNALAPADKAKCASAVITLSFDPDEVRLDMTNYYYQNRMSQQIEPIGGFDYVNEFTFGIKAQTSVNIKFYKLDTTLDYTYPIINSTPVVEFSSS